MERHEIEFESVGSLQSHVDLAAHAAKCDTRDGAVSQLGVQLQAMEPDVDSRDRKSVV